MSDDSAIALKGACFCGALAYQVKGKPVLSAYCHCTSCQRLTGCPFIHALHYADANFSWAANVSDDSYDRFILPEKSWKSRLRCKACGVGVATYNIKTDRWSILAPHLERGGEGKIMHSEVIKPTAHIFYGSRLLDIKDDIGKWIGYENQSDRCA